MKKINMFVMMVLILSFICAGVTLAAGKKDKAEKPLKKETMTIEASGTALWKHLTESAYTKKWKLWPGKKEFYPGKEPHGALLTTYVNAPALQAIQGKKGKMPVGAVVVKENYSPDRKLMAITVMYKVKGYNPDAGDWFWAKYGPEGKVDAEGRLDMCVQCHSAQKANDYLYAGKLK